MPEIRENLLSAVKSEIQIRNKFVPAKRKKSAIHEIKLPRKCHATRYVNNA